MAMLDWLRSDALSPSVAIGEKELPLVIRRHPAARRMTLRLAPDGGEVRVTLPRWGRSAEALEFARSRADWLAAQLNKIPQRQTPQPGEALTYRGSDVAIIWHAAAPRAPRLEAGQLVLGGPEHSIARRLQRWLEGEATRLMEADLAEYCTHIGRTPPAMRLSRAQRRWGSCSPDGTIRMNWRLVQAPDAVRRSVVAHEVVHLVHFNHSPAFHTLLDEIFDDDIASANSWLKQHGRCLYVRFG
jgi:predicted metal-dependent hydrolase